MLYERYLENVLIYGENLSWLYLVCALVSFFAVWFTWNTQPKTSNNTENYTEFSSSDISSDISDLTAGSANPADRKALLETIEKNLSVDEKEKEVLTEKQQLLDILLLMKSDEKFNAVTLEELEEQMKLYK